MKKVLALVLAAVMALALCTVAIAAEIPGLIIVKDADVTTNAGYEDFDFFYGEGARSWMIFNSDYLGLEDSLSAVSAADDVTNFVDYDLAAGQSDFFNKKTAAVWVDSTGPVTASVSKVANADNDGFAVKLTITPNAEKRTVAKDLDKYKVTVKIGSNKASHNVNNSVTIKVEGDDVYVTNARCQVEGDAKYDGRDNTGIHMSQKLNGDYEINDAHRVIDVSVFEKAKGNNLTLQYTKGSNLGMGTYTISTKVANQNTSMYYGAKTGIVEGKAIASIDFWANLVKDKVVVTMPITNDNENWYGETVYVYNVKDGKPTGDAIEGKIVNNNAVVFEVAAGSRLGTFAAYGDKAEGEAEKPAIPETGANDIVNVAIVFAVVALAAAGFVAVKKASK